MKKRISIVLPIVILLSLVIPLQLVMAQNATGETWTSAISYVNTSSSSGSMTVTFYDGSTSYPSSPIAVTGHQNGTIYVGSISTTPALPSGFKGSAVLSSTVPMAVVEINYSVDNPDTYSRTYYSGFGVGQANHTVYVTTVEKTKWDDVTTSRIGVQNVDSSNTANITLHFIERGETTPDLQVTKSIAPQASYVFSMLDADFSSIPDSWTGSLKITTDPQVDILAAAMQTSGNNRYAYTFESVKTGENTIYVPTMLCHYSADDQVSYYAVQANGGTANVTIRHYDRDTGAQLGTTFGPVELTDGAKYIINPCNEGGVPSGAIGSSKVSSTGAPVNVIVKVNGATGLRTAYIAVGTGANNVALPFVSWDDVTTAGLRTYIAVMNIDDSDSGEDITATYYNQNGTEKRTHTLASISDPLAPFQKANSSLNWGSGGVNEDWQGAVIIESDVPVFVTVRTQRAYTTIPPISQLGEDYTGIPFTP
jgi:hypothetical protein